MSACEASMSFLFLSWETIFNVFLLISKMSYKELKKEKIRGV